MAAQALFLGCGLVFLGITFALVGVISLQPALRSLRWPAASGEITESDPVAGVRYTYTAAGRVYTGSRVSFHDSGLFSGRLGAPTAQTPAGYPAGMVVQVYYDPKAPDRSVLEPGAGTLAFLPVGVGGLLFVIGLTASLFAFVR